MKFDKPYKVSELAKLLVGSLKIIGDNDFLIKGMNEIHMVEEGDITFVDHSKYYDKALTSKASVILINKEADCPKGKVLIVCENPLNNMNTLTKHFKPFIPCSSAISESAQIGEGTIIQPHVFVGNNVKIGKNCIIHSNVSIYDDCIIGNNVIIQSNTVIGGDACYFQRKENKFTKYESSGRTILGDNVEIGALCAVDRGVSGDTIIGEGTKLDNLTQIGHDTHIGKHCLISAQCAIAGVTIIEDNVLIWGQVAINKDLTIGEGAVILATSAVDRSLEGGKTYFGVPAIEARKKWKELAALKCLPDIIEKLNL